MIRFTISKKSERSNARLGVIKTSHGEIETPAFVPVATQAVIKTLDSKEVLETGSQILICNTFHLHLKPGKNIVAKNGGLHEFMNWPKPLMTDSAGYQVFSFGFGKDYNTGKILRDPRRQIHPPARPKLRNKEGNDPNHHKIITKKQQPQDVKITSEGVWFHSPVDGHELFIGPRESIKIQEKLEADIIFAFDECSSPLADYNYNKKALDRTNRWAKECLAVKKSKQAIFGIVQGGKFKNLRIESAGFIGSLPFDGFGIGGEFGNNKKTMIQMLKWTIKELPQNKPRHLLGIGHLEDIPEIIKEGVDMFDCIVPTHYARHGYSFVSDEPRINTDLKTDLHGYKKLDMQKSEFLKDRGPLDRNCNCYVCKNYTRSYISHLMRAKEITALKLITFHNLYFFNKSVEKIRNDIRKNRI